MRRFLTLLSVATALGGCNIDIETPCSGVDCSGHGYCELVEERGESRPWCRCDDGYLATPDGRNCYRPGGPPPDADTDR